MKRIRFFSLLLLLCFLFGSCASKSIYTVEWRTGDEVSGVIVSATCKRKWKRDDNIELIVGFGRDEDKRLTVNRGGYVTTILSIEASDFVIEDHPGYYDYEITDLEDHKYIWPTSKYQNNSQSYVRYQTNFPPYVKTITLSVPEGTKQASGRIDIYLYAYYGNEGNITNRVGTGISIYYTIDEKHIVFK